MNEPKSPKWLGIMMTSQNGLTRVREHQASTSKLKITWQHLLRSISYDVWKKSGFPNWSNAHYHYKYFAPISLKVTIFSETCKWCLSMHLRAPKHAYNDKKLPMWLWMLQVNLLWQLKLHFECTCNTSKCVWIIKSANDASKCIWMIQTCLWYCNMCLSTPKHATAKN